MATTRRPARVEEALEPPPTPAEDKQIPAIFFRTEAGGEPVREWLKALSREDRKRIGEDIKTVEFGWPMGMPTCRPLGNGMHETRSQVGQNRIARVLFYVDKLGRMVLLHGFIKTTRKTPLVDLEWREGISVCTKEDFPKEGNETHPGI